MLNAECLARERVGNRVGVRRACAMPGGMHCAQARLEELAYPAPVTGAAGPAIAAVLTHVLLFGALCGTNGLACALNCCVAAGLGTKAPPAGGAPFSCSFTYKNVSPGSILHAI